MNITIISIKASTVEFSPQIHCNPIIINVTARKSSISQFGLLIFSQYCLSAFYI